MRPIHLMTAGLIMLSSPAHADDKPAARYTFMVVGDQLIRGDAVTGVAELCRYVFIDERFPELRRYECNLDGAVVSGLRRMPDKDARKAYRDMHMEEMNAAKGQ